MFNGTTIIILCLAQKNGASWIQPPSAILLKPAHQAVQGLSVGFLQRKQAEANLASAFFISMP